MSSVPTGAARSAAVAGLFYPSDPVELARTVDDLVESAAPGALDNVVALLAPHAGYAYSGPVAAHAYALLEGRKFDRVVVLSPSHYAAFHFASVYDGAAYTTPLGRIPVDREFAARLAQSTTAVKLSPAGHVPAGDRGEHAIEVQLPFLQRSLGHFTLVPIVMGDQAYDACRGIGTALADLVQGTPTLLVASSDLSHFHPYSEAAALDRKALRLVEEYDYLNLARNLELGVVEACGGGPVVAAMIAAERLGATRAAVLRYANSGDTSGDLRRVVGYGAAAFWNAPAAGMSEDAVSLSQPERDALLEIARRSVESAVRGGRRRDGSSAGLKALERDRGAFVTLTNRGRLRGCIGYVTPIKPLCAAVHDLAALAATRDPRFRPVAANELPDLEYEISVLSSVRRVRDAAEVQLGRDGLLIHNGPCEGVLLPQVACEQHWDRTTFLEQACRKAGLPHEAWHDPAVDVFRFSALVFGRLASRAPELAAAAAPERCSAGIPRVV